MTCDVNEREVGNSARLPWHSMFDNLKLHSLAFLKILDTTVAFTKWSPLFHDLFDVTEKFAGKRMYKY